MTIVGLRGRLKKAKQTASTGSYISNGLLSLFFSIPCFLDRILHFTLNLNKVCLQLLLGVYKICILDEWEHRLSTLNNLPISTISVTVCVVPESAGVSHAHWHQPAQLQPICGFCPSAPEQLAAPRSQPASGCSCAPPWQPAPSFLREPSEPHRGAAEHPGRETIITVKLLLSKQYLPASLRKLSLLKKQ